MVMQILKNRYFIVGNLILLLTIIPVILFLVKQQQSTDSQAAKASILSFNPPNSATTTACTEFSVDVRVDPGTNVVSIVDLFVSFDATALQLLEITPDAQVFPTTVRPGDIQNTTGSGSIMVSIGPNVTNAVRTVSRVATLKFKPLKAGNATITIDPVKSQVLSLAPSDKPTENVLASTSPGAVAVTQSTTCSTAATTPGAASPTPTTGPTSIPSPTTPIGAGPTSIPTTIPTPTSTATISATPTPSGPNQLPICTNLTVSPAATGSAPFSVLFSGEGNDPDGTIAKATFNFGDGITLDVTDGLSKQFVTIQQSHTYQGGNFSAFLTLTDNRGGVSSASACTLAIGVSGSPTPPSKISPTGIPTATPSITSPGGISATFGIIGGVLLLFVGGILLLSL